MPMIDNYTVTKLTLDSVLKNCDVPFHKFIIIASGTTNENCLGLLKDIKSKGLNGFPTEKFYVEILSEQEGLGFAESMNRAIDLLESDEDLFYTANNNWFSKGFMSRLQEAVYLNTQYLAVQCRSIFWNENQLKESYDATVRDFLVSNPSVPMAISHIQKFFQTTYHELFEELVFHTHFILSLVGELRLIYPTIFQTLKRRDTWV